MDVVKKTSDKVLYPLDVSEIVQYASEQFGKRLHAVERANQ
jgi:hypothetical protein